MFFESYGCRKRWSLNHRRDLLQQEELLTFIAFPELSGIEINKYDFYSGTAGDIYVLRAESKLPDEISRIF